LDNQNSDLVFFERFIFRNLIKDIAMTSVAVYLQNMNLDIF